jgi:hypothetical protein
MNVLLQILDRSVLVKTEGFSAPRGGPKKIRRAADRRDLALRERTEAGSPLGGMEVNPNSRQSRTFAFELASQGRVLP